MNSIITAKSKLPMDFIQNLYKEFNERTADKILTGMLEKRYVTLRVNTIKSSINEIERIFNDFNIEFEKVEFYKDAFIIKNKTENDLQKFDFYKQGLIYVQSLSSMVPPIILNPKRGESILDLTAAPGSKTTQMAASMNNEGYILANEIDKIRCEKLKYNIDMQGVKIAEVSNFDGRNIKYEERFDKVLLDTPCSGEGRFLLENEKTYSNWSEKMVKELSLLQRELLTSGYNALKKGGLLVYSTCTLNNIENEKNIDWAIKKLNMQVLDIDIKIKDAQKASNKGLSKDIEKAIKILPSKRMEGFFVCLLKK